MKILHTSDWHLGQALYGYDRREEHSDMLSQICEIVKEELPDVFLLCGDVFHIAQPSAAAGKMFVDALTQMHSIHPEMIMVVTAGNHDSGSRHEVFSELWKNLKVYTPGVLHEDNINHHIIRIPGKGFVIAMPYVHQRILPVGFFQKLLEEVERLNAENLPVVMTAHTTIKNSIFSGHDDATEFSAGGIESVEISDFGQGYDYLALGHIHQSQYPDPSNKRVRYCGTPISVNFDETKVHSVTIVQIEEHGALPVIREREISNPRPLLTLPAEGAVDWETARSLLRDFPYNQEAYIRINVEVKDFLTPGAYEEALQLTKNKRCKFCLINAIRKKIDDERNPRSFSLHEFKQENPFDIFRRYLVDQGLEMDDDLEEMFRESLKESEEN